MPQPHLLDNEEYCIFFKRVLMGKGFLTEDFLKNKSRKEHRNKSRKFKKLEKAGFINIRKKANLNTYYVYFPGVAQAFWDFIFTEFTQLSGLAKKGSANPALRDKRLEDVTNFVEFYLKKNWALKEPTLRKIFYHILAHSYQIYYKYAAAHEEILKEVKDSLPLHVQKTLKEELKKFRSIHGFIYDQVTRKAYYDILLKCENVSEVF